MKRKAVNEYEYIEIGNALLWLCLESGLNPKYIKGRTFVDLVRVNGQWVLVLKPKGFGPEER